MRNASVGPAILLFAFVAWTATAQSPSPDSPRFQAATMARAFLASDTPAGEFVVRDLAESTRRSIGDETAARRLEAIRAELAGYELVGLRPASELVAEMVWQKGNETRSVQVAYDPDPPHKITEIAVLGGTSLSGAASPAGAESDDAGPALTWDNLEQRITKEVDDGFSGVIVITRDGETVLDGAFGYANREKKIENRRDTIFGIGSTPIDFTHVGILMLVEQGKLSLNDPLTKFFDNVPEDKWTITVDHLRTGRSGLRDFHGVPEDGNPDHFWIDRDEAIRRIFGQELLFSPGEGREHSHSAWGVLAAILEIVSGESYQQFTEKRIFTPLGMKDTGFYGEPIPEKRMAIGYGMQSSGEINAPPYWGKTSWLVMGSGGQVSTAGDMIRFVRGMREGKLLEPEMGALLLEGWDGVLAGGSIFGYEIVYTTDPDNMMILISNFNDAGEDSKAVRLGLELAELVLAADRPPFSLGIGLEFDSEVGLTISQVMPGSAAERDGLESGDGLISANGVPFGDDPMAVLDPLLRAGERIRFEVLRDGKQLIVAVQPNPR